VKSQDEGSGDPRSTCVSPTTTTAASLDPQTLLELGWPRLLRELARELCIEHVAARMNREVDALESSAASQPTPVDPLVSIAGDLREIRRREEQTRAMAHVVGAAPRACERWRGALRDLADPEAALDRAGHGGTLDVDDLWAVAGLIAADRQARAVFDAGVRAASELSSLVEALAPAEEATGFERGLGDALELDERGRPRISSRASPELARARAEEQSSRRARAKAADALVRRHGAELSDALWTERDGRSVLPVRAGALGPFHRSGSLIQGTSASGQTFYVEPPELVAANNAARESSARVRREVARICTELGRGIAERVDEFRSRARAVVLADLRWAAFRLGARLGAPEVPASTPVAALDAPSGADGSAGRVELVNARHPLLVLRGIDVVPLSLVLSLGHGLVISGPNAGGKTVALKTIGLFALMVRAGIPLPCDEGTVFPVFERVVTDVGDGQSLAADLSTFSAQIARIRHALDSAGPGTLVLFDEIATGTDPEQGAALAEAVLQSLVERGCTLVVTTHYDRLKRLGAEPGARFSNAAVGFDMDRMEPTFELRTGIPGGSSALAVARRLGLDADVVGRAEANLDQAARRVDAMLEALDRERTELRREHDAVSRERDVVRRRARKLEEQQARAERGARSKKTRAWEEAADALRAMERELKARRKALRRAGGDLSRVPTRADATADARALLDTTREVDAPAPGAVPDALEVGDRVLVGTLATDGVVIGLKPGRAVVETGLGRTTVRRSELRVAPTPATKKRAKRTAARPVYVPSAQTGRHFGADARPVAANIDNRFDLRGVRAEEAAEAVDRLIAEAIGRDLDVAVIVHGHGSGALRAAVRERLRQTPQARKLRTGLREEGGDAVTVVWVDG
jgi:DNA mismatch repair protein MutS2